MMTRTGRPTVGRDPLHELSQRSDDHRDAGADFRDGRETVPNQEQLTKDKIEKRGAAWSPDGTRILFACRVGPPDAAGLGTFEICVMDAVADAPATRLTTNNQHDLTPNWSPDGLAIGSFIAHRQTSSG